MKLISKVTQSHFWKRATIKWIKTSTYYVYLAENFYEEKMEEVMDSWNIRFPFNPYYENTKLFCLFSLLFRKSWAVPK